MKVYTGIGSREITQKEQEFIHELSRQMERQGFTCYSGGAPGADSAFDFGSSNCISWSPWRNFPRQKLRGTIMVPEEECKGTPEWGQAWASIHQFHPRSEMLKEGARKMMFRNYFQVAGSPSQGYPMSELVIFCADEVVGKVLVDGGTGQAVRIASSKGIPCFNVRTMRYLSGSHQVLTDLLLSLG